MPKEEKIVMPGVGGRVLKYIHADQDTEYTPLTGALQWAPFTNII